MEAKLEFDLNLDKNGHPEIRFRHYDKSKELEQQVLNVFLEMVKEKGIRIVHIGGFSSAQEIYQEYAIRPVVEVPNIEKLEPKPDKFSPEARFAHIIEGLVVKQDAKNAPYSDFYCKGGEIYFEHHKKNEVIWCNYDKTWAVFVNKFGMKGKQVQAFIKVQMEKHYNLREVTPKLLNLHTHLRWRSITI